MDMSLSELRELVMGWRTGRPGALRFMGSQRVGHDWATELNWTDAKVEKWLISLSAQREQETHTQPRSVSHFRDSISPLWIFLYSQCLNVSFWYFLFYVIILVRSNINILVNRVDQALKFPCIFSSVTFIIFCMHYKDIFYLYSWGHKILGLDSYGPWLLCGQL